MTKKLIILLAFILISAPAFSAKLYKESYYQTKWAQDNGGICEYKLPDGTRVDILTNEYAIEFDFAKKWAEAVGQSLHYGRMTGKKPAIVLIIEQPSDFVYYNRLKPICSEHNICLWYMKSPAYQKKSTNNIDKDSVCIK